MTLRAPDIKDEHGWQILDDEAGVLGHASSRDKAREIARRGFVDDPDNPTNEVEILPADNSPEAVAARAAWDVDQRIKAAVRAMKQSWVDLAASLYVFSQNEMWEALGYESWRAYLADPDVGIDERQAYEWTAIYQQLVIQREVDPERLKVLHYTKVAKLLPAIRRDQVTVDSALADAEALSRSDLEARYSGKFQPQKNQRGRPDTSSTVHTDSEPTWARCPTCGSRYRVDPETGERVDT